LAANENEIAGLRRLGLTENESKIYLALLRMGTTRSTSSQLSFFAHVPRTKTYPAVKELERKGLVTITPGKPELFSPCSPMEVLMPIVSKLDQDAKDSEKVVQSLAMAYESSKYVKRNLPKQSEQFWEMKGRQEILSKLNELMRDATRSIDYSTTPTGLIRAYKAHADALEHAAKSGARVRLLSQITSENSSLAAEFQEIVDFKPIQDTLTTFVCVDSKELVVIDSMPEDVRTDRGSDTAAWTTNRLVVELFERLFDKVWQSIPAKENQ